MKSKNIILAIAVLTGIFMSGLALADLVNPDYYTRHCPLTKVEKECSYQKTADRKITSGECKIYSENPQCELLVGEGHSFSGKNKYCCQPDYSNYFYSVILSEAKKLGLTLLLTLLLELAIFWIFGFRTKKVLFSFAAANVISVISFYLAGLWLYYLAGFPFVIISEAVIIIFEAVFLAAILKGANLKKIMLATLTANLVSAVLGGILYSFILIA
jgi:hypothetical protein